ncbi:MAG TPA: hypothetical protein VM580_28020 [Labilithrix sp.]|nr:hypothetical protein [Labilithrix sp.]
MKITRIQRGLVLLIVAAGTFAVGCELIVDFDRTKIPVDSQEASVADVNVPDSSGSLSDAGADVQDAGLDADVESDAGTDADTDADAD